MAKGPGDNNKAALSKPDPPPAANLLSILSSPSARKALQLIILAAIYSPISWLSLTPVYGSVPSALYHDQGKLFASLAGFLGRAQLRKILPLGIIKWLPVFAFWIPSIQFVLFKGSSALGSQYGPIVTELLTYYPLTLLSLFAAATFLDDVDFVSLGSTIAYHGPSISTYILFTAVERMAKSVILRNIGSSVALSRVGLQLIVATIYVLTIPSVVSWLAVPSILVTMMFNVHNPLQRTTNQLNSTLQGHNFTLIDRQESITGYISVLDNTAAHYRVMRCDHSLLGGEWRIPPRSGRKRPKAQEPIYGIFAMLEAVRLAETDNGRPRRPDSDSTALNIGLGIGTAPGALIAHGINTTIVELDPVVYNFAVKYFNLPSNHTPIIGDAVHLVEDARARNIGTKYDYIIHDVFTGGAEPVDLFTQEFLSGLHYLLKNDGIIAINYAGDLSLPAASHVIRTILSVFPTCRIFREALPENPAANITAPGEKEGEGKEDFTNMVIFCKHPSSSSRPLVFRPPANSDFLDSGARQQFLFPRPELEIKKDAFALDGPLLKRGQTRQLEMWHQRSAVGHWGVMRTVLPAVVWENW